MRVVYCAPGSRPDPWLAGLRAALPGADVYDWSPGAAPADHAVVWAPPQAFADEQSSLRAVWNLGAGVDALLRLRWRDGLPLVRLEDAGMASQMVEYVLHALLRHYRGFDAYERDGREGRWLQRRPPRRSEWPVGVLGLGVLGAAVARAVAGLGFPVHGWSRTPRTLDGVKTHAGDAALGDFLAATRVLVVLLPLTDATRNLLDRGRLAQLQRGGVVINLARGALVVESDLIALLDEDHLAGATLDVFRDEPLPADHPLRRHARIAITPHIAAQTLREDSLAQIAGKILAFERGEPVTGIIDRARGY
ncbi:MAG: glyoxylate/hydroxypyruvate reductase A [Ideonella sp.]|nr:glyoxylate/hydroxypyruvate reductase A [Ideonella sp.]